MPTQTYIPLANITLGTAASSVTFSSIPATYRDLVLVMNGQLSSSGQFFYRFNSDSGVNYFWITAMGLTTSATRSAAYTENKLAPWEANNLDSGTRFDLVAQVMDYSATDKDKTTLNRFNGTVSSTGLTAMTAGRWANTSAITSIAIIGNVNFAVGTTASLYGIAS